VPPQVNIDDGFIVQVNKEIAFHMTATDKDGKVVHYSWDFDINDDITIDRDSASTTYTYKEPGNYVLRATAKDNNGGTTNVEVPVTVENAIPV